MEIPHLRQFIVLAKELHFGRAAEKLGLAQPTLSQQILALERDLGVRLFERTKRRVALTNAGVVLLREAEGLLGAIESASEHVREADRGTRGALVIGCSTPAIGSWLPHIIREFTSEFRDVELTMDVMHSRPLFELLQQRRVHVAFARAGMSAPGILSERLWEQPYRVILPEGHPKSTGDAVRLRDLAGETLVTMSRRLLDGSFDRLIAMCRREGFDPRTIREVDRVDSIVGMVACRLGVSILPDSVETRGNGIVAKPIALTDDAENSTLWTSVYWNEDERSRLVLSFLSCMREHSPAVGTSSSN